MTTLSLVIRPERPEDAPAIDRLQARAFGPGRFARTAYRLREKAAERIDLGVTASVGSFLVERIAMLPGVGTTYGGLAELIKGDSG